MLVMNVLGYKKKELNDLILAGYFKDSYDQLSKFRLMSMALGSNNGLKINLE